MSLKCIYERKLRPIVLCHCTTHRQHTPAVIITASEEPKTQIIVLARMLTSHFYYKSLMLLTWHVINIGVCDSQLVPGGGGLHREVPPAAAPQAQQQGEY